MFQHTRFNRDDTRKLVHTINRAIGEGVVPDANLDAIFEKMWSELESHVAEMPSAQETPQPLPSIEEMTAEILELSRAAANSRKQSEWLDQLAPDFKDFLPVLMQGLKGLDPNQLLPAPPPPPPPREPTAIFCVKLIGDSDVKRVEGTVAAFTAAGQLVVLIGNEVVGKFESVESWWRESENLPETQ
jgi:hypothetical protein